MASNSSPLAEIWIEVNGVRTDECNDGTSQIAILEYDDRPLTPYRVVIKLKRPPNPDSNNWGYKFYLDGLQDPTGKYPVLVRPHCVI